MEGAELGVFRGALSTLARCRPCVLFEHGMGGVSTYGTSSVELRGELERVGLSVWRLDHWLDGQPPLTADGFDTAVKSPDYWNFLAGPTPREGMTS